MSFQLEKYWCELEGKKMATSDEAGIFNFDRKTVAQIIGCSSEHLANLEAKGCPLIVCVKVGKKTLYQLPDVVDFLVNQRASASPRRRGPRTNAERMQTKTERGCQ